MDNVCVYGKQNKKFLIALIVPNLKELKKLIDNGNSNSVEGLCSDPVVIDKVLRALRSAAGLSRVELPARIKLCTDDWLPDNGLVTPSFKIRRNVIEQHYRVDINRLFDS